MSRISIYPNIREVKEGYIITVKTALNRIKDGNSKELLLQILKAKTKKEKNSLKSNLPSVTFSGVFSERKDDCLVEASGFMVLDFDDVNNVEAKKKELAANSYIYACWVSPSGNGLKALVRIGDHTRFEDHFKEIQKEFKGLDPSGKNISRVCYESYDPNIYINENAKIFSKLPQEGYQVKNWDSVNKALRKIEDSVDGEKHNVRIRIAYLFGGWVAAREMTYDDAIKLLTQAVLKNTSDADSAIKDIEQSLAAGMKKPCTISEERDILDMRVGVGRLWVNMGEVEQEILDFQRNGYQKGSTVGFSACEDLISFIEGGVTYIYGAPYSGKSNLTHEICINLSENYGWNWVLLTPETGSVAQVYGELTSIKSRKSFVGGGSVNPEHSKFIRDHFVVIDTRGMEFYMKDFYTQVEGIERELGKKIHGTVIDPHNYLDFDLKLREDRAIGKDLDLMLSDARDNKRHNILVTHVRDQQLRFVKNSQGIAESSYYPVASPREIQYGQIFFRKGMQMLSVWRPIDTDGNPLMDNEGNEYDLNETHVHVQKSKPKGVGRTGMFRLWYDSDKNRYYEKTLNANRSYAYGKIDEMKPLEVRDMSFEEISLPEEK